MKLIQDQIINLYNYQKHDGDKTGQALLINKTKYVIIYVDINKNLPKSEIKTIRMMFLDQIECTWEEYNGKLQRIVITGNGNLHLNSLWDSSLPLEKRRTCGIFKNIKNKLWYNIDIFTHIDPDKKIIMSTTKYKDNWCC